MNVTGLCGVATSRMTPRLIAAPKFVARPSLCTLVPHPASVGPSSDRLSRLASAAREVSAHGYKQPSTRGDTAVLTSSIKPAPSSMGTSDFMHSRAAGGVLLVAGCVLLMLVEPQTAHCEELSGSALDVFQSFLVSWVVSVGMPYRKLMGVRNILSTFDELSYGFRSAC